MEDVCLTEEQEILAVRSSRTWNSLVEIKGSGNLFPVRDSKIDWTEH